MFGEQHDAGGNSAAEAAEAARAFENEMFNTPVNLRSDDDDYLPVNFGGNPEGQQNDDFNPQGQQDPPPADEVIVFDDNLETLEGESEEDKIIKELTAKGYVVNKQEEIPLDEQFREKLKVIDSVIAKANEFISLPNVEICREKIKTDKANFYRTTGRESMIGSEEFNIDVDAEAERFVDDPAFAEIYANNVRREVKEGILKQKQEEKDGVTKEIDSAYNSKVTENKSNLQASLTKIYKEGFAGQKFTQEELNVVYKNVISGNFSKQVKDNPDALIELALIQAYKEKILGKTAGGPTYGEGVKAAVDALRGKEATRSPLGVAIDKSANANSRTGAYKRDWSDIVDMNEESMKGKKVIGG
jgi:hypothetical protein